MVFIYGYMELDIGMVNFLFIVKLYKSYMVNL